VNAITSLYILSPYPVLIVIGIFGAIIGSFLTVCIYRIPYGRPSGPPTFEEMNGIEVEPEAGEQTKIAEDSHSDEETLSIGKPARSFCPKCKNKLLWWHNIPILSWLILGGRCYFCKERVSFRYPFVEVITSVLAVASVYSFELTPTALLVFAYCATLVVISFIDIEYYIIPDVISLPGIVLGLMVGGLNHYTQIFTWPLPETIWGNLIGLGFGGGVLLLISELYLRIRKRVGLGLGDVKLLAMTGAFFGLQGAFSTMFFGSLLGSVIGISLMLLARKGLSHHLPFGPYLALGTIIYIFSGPSLLFRF